MDWIIGSEDLVPHGKEINGSWVIYFHDGKRAEKYKFKTIAI